MKKPINIPEIRIKYNRLIDPIFIFYCQNNPELKKSGWNDWVPPQKEGIDRRVENYKTEWVKYEEKILKGLIEITGLDFKNQIIDVHIVSGNPRQISNPLIIKSGFLPDEFVDVLTHELLHRLLTINKIKKEIMVSEKYTEETVATQNHIIVHALLKYIYLDILKDDSRLRKNIEDSKKHSTNEYARAWDIVEKEGYMKLINEFKDKLSK